jgi:hypothetical protein
MDKSYAPVSTHVNLHGSVSPRTCGADDGLHGLIEVLDHLRDDDTLHRVLLPEVRLCPTT